MPGLFGGGSSSGSTTATSSNAPWTEQQPYLKQGWQGAQNLYQNYTPQYYTGNTVADLNGQQTGALNAMWGYGMNGGSPTTQSANNYATNVLNGNYLSAGNPYFQGMVNQIAQGVQPQVDSQFAAAGRYGSGAAANAFASALTNQAGQLAYQNYNNGVNNQIKALTLAPSLNATNLSNYSAALGAGNAYQTQAQNQITADQARWNYNQNLPYDILSRYQAGIGQPTGSQGSQSTPYYTNPTATALGLGTLGLGAYNSGMFGNLFGSGSSGGGLWSDVGGF